MLGHKSSLRKFKKIEIISSIFSDHNTMRLEINYREKSIKNKNTGRLNNMVLNNQEITKDIREEITTAQRQMTRKHNHLKPMGCSKTVLKGKFIAIKS